MLKAYTVTDNNLIYFNSSYFIQKGTHFGEKSAKDDTKLNFLHLNYILY